MLHGEPQSPGVHSRQRTPLCSAETGLSPAHPKDPQNWPVGSPVNNPLLEQLVHAVPIGKEMQESALCSNLRAQWTLLGIKDRETAISVMVLSHWAGRAQHHFRRSSTSCTNNPILVTNHPLWMHPMVLNEVCALVGHCWGAGADREPTLPPQSLLVAYRAAALHTLVRLAAGEQLAGGEHLPLLVAGPVVLAGFDGCPQARRGMWLWKR